MSHGVPYFVWRAGRPRWSPGPELRAAGHKGKDLRDEQGQFLPLDAALAEAMKLNADSGMVRKVAMPNTTKMLPAPPNRAGNIYFLWAGDRIKIGFSTRPAGRLGGLITAVADPVKFFGAIKGTRGDEAALHARLAGHRANGEWFKASFTVRRTMQRVILEALEKEDRCEAASHGLANSLARSHDVPRETAEMMVSAQGLEPWTY